MFDMDDFHFHLLRHTYTTNLLSHGAAPEDVQELLGHSDVSTTMNIYAHATREAKRTSARLLDKVVDSVYMRLSQNSQPNSDTPDMNSRKER